MHALRANAPRAHSAADRLDTSIFHAPTPSGIIAFKCAI